MATTSGRGVITSRTRLSPNSTTCSISRASSCSIIPSSVAASTSASMACWSPTSATGSSSDTCSTDTRSSSTNWIGHMIQTKKRTTGTNGAIQSPGSPARSTEGQNCIAITTSALRKKTISTAVSHVPGTKKITPRAVTAATSTSHNRVEQIENQARPCRRSILKRGSISASKVSRWR